MLIVYVIAREQLKCAKSKIYKITKMTQMTGNTFHSSATQKFATDSIHTGPATKPAPHLEPIDYDRWAQLEFKDELTGA